MINVCFLMVEPCSTNDDCSHHECKDGYESRCSSQKQCYCENIRGCVNDTDCHCSNGHTSICNNNQCLCQCKFCNFHKLFLYKAISNIFKWKDLLLTRDLSLKNKNTEVSFRKAITITTEYILALATSSVLSVSVTGPQRWPL